MSKSYLIIICIFLSACGTKPISQKVRNDFTLRFEGRDTELAAKIRIDGYYVMKVQSTSNKTLDVNIMLFKDGTFAKSFQILKTTENDARPFFGENFHNETSYWGIYQLNGDTIITQYISRASWMAPWDSREEWFLIIDSTSLQSIFAKPIGFEVSKDLLKTHWHNRDRYSPSLFVPSDTLPPSDNWLKEEKWLWRNEKDWEEYMRRKRPHLR
jgi:hypothetical protein